MNCLTAALIISRFMFTEESFSFMLPMAVIVDLEEVDGEQGRSGPGG